MGSFEVGRQALILSLGILEAKPTFPRGSGPASLSNGRCVIIPLKRTCLISKIKGGLVCHPQERRYVIKVVKVDGNEMGLTVSNVLVAIKEKKDWSEERTITTLANMFL